MSLYDIVREKREEKHNPVSRLVYAVYLSESAIQKVDVEQVVTRQVRDGLSADQRDERAARAD